MIDIMPTILEAVGLPQPVSVYGVGRAPVEGVSMTYAFLQKYREGRVKAALAQ